jgi:type I restriction enzyme M protein
MTQALELPRPGKRRLRLLPHQPGNEFGEGANIAERACLLQRVHILVPSLTHRELADEDIARIANTYHAWRGEKIIPSPSMGEGEGGGEYKDIPGFCKSATLKEIRKHGHVLTPGRYVGAEAQEDDGEPFEEKMRRLVAQLREQQAEARRLDDAIAKNLKELGFG